MCLLSRALGHSESKAIGAKCPRKVQCTRGTENEVVFQHALPTRQRYVKRTLDAGTSRSNHVHGA